MSSQNITTTRKDCSIVTIPVKRDGVAFTPGSAFTFTLTVKRHQDDDDDDAIFQKITGAGITHSGTSIIAHLVTVDTEEEDPGKYWYGVKGQEIATGDAFEAADGRWIIKQETAQLPEPSVDIYTTSPASFGSAGTAAIIHAATADMTPIDADEIPFANSAASWALGKWSWSTIKASLATYFGGIYAAISHTHTGSQITDATTNATPNTIVIRGSNGAGFFADTNGSTPALVANTVDGYAVYASATGSGTAIRGNSATGDHANFGNGKLVIANGGSVTLTGTITSLNYNPGAGVATAIAATLDGTGGLASKAYADSLVVGLLDDRGNHNASGNVFPSSGGSGTAGSILKGDLWTISVAGTLGGTAVTAGDVLRAIADTPGQTAGNWTITENNLGYVPQNTAGTLALAGFSSITGTISLTGNVSGTLADANIASAAPWNAAASSVNATALIITKAGVRVPYTASADTDAARGIALTNAILAMTTGQTLICSPGDYYMATLNLLLVGDCTYQWNGPRLYINGSSTGRVGGEAALAVALFTSGFATAPTNVSNWRFIGTLTLDGGSVSGKRGMFPISATGALVHGVTFKNWSDTGFYAYGGSQKGCRISDCYFDSCAGTAAQFDAEYWEVSNCQALTCGVGFVTGGNTAFANCSATFCTYGLKVMNTGNPGHGTWVGGNVNHCTTGVYTDPAITAASGGWSFSGAIAHSTAFDLNGKGITWTGGEIANTTFGSTGANAGVSIFRNVRCLSTSTAESTSLAALSAAERANMKFHECRDEAGAAMTWNDSVEMAYVGKTANYTITGADRTINVTSNSPTITLPTAVNCAGRQYLIANTGAGTVTMATTSSQTIDGASPGTIATTVRLRVESDGANWLTW